MRPICNQLIIKYKKYIRFCFQPFLFLQKHKILENYHLADVSKLTTFTRLVFDAMGCPEQDTRQAADVLVQSDLRGIDSHGVARLSGYVRLWEAGRINSRPDMKLVREKSGTGTLDGDGGLGLVTAPFAMRIAIEKAEEHGSGWIAIRNSNHFGICGYHSMMALAHDMIGMALTNASPLVSPARSKERMLGTNPISYAIPAGDEPPVVIDLATSAAANGKLEIAKRAGKSIPEGWLKDKDGRFSTDPDDLKGGGSLVPLGSNADLGNHKGYALSAWVDIMSGVLSGANYGPWVPPFVSFLPLQPDMPGEGIGHFVGAMQVDGFRPIDEFKKNMDQWIRRFRSAAPTDPDLPVLIPGDPEREASEKRTVDGIPLIEIVYDDLKQLADKFGIPFQL